MNPARSLQVVGIETEKVSKEKAVADEEEQKVAAIAVVVSGKQRDCEEDLAKAEPALHAAEDALNTLNRVSWSPLPRCVSLICSIVLFLVLFPSLSRISYVHTGLELHKRLLNHRI